VWNFAHHTSSLPCTFACGILPRPPAHATLTSPRLSAASAASAFYPSRTGCIADCCLMSILSLHACSLQPLGLLPFSASRLNSPLQSVPRFTSIRQIGSRLPVAADAEECDVAWRERWRRARSISSNLAGDCDERVSTSVCRSLKSHPASAVAAGGCLAHVHSLHAGCIVFDDFALALAVAAPPPPAAAPVLSVLHLTPCFLTSPSLIAPFTSLLRLSLSRHSSTPHWHDDDIARACAGLQVRCEV
jgi:hypothetical protein